MSVDESIKVISISQAAKLTGFGRDRISQAMARYKQTRGRYGLAYIAPETEGGYRRIRVSALRAWLQRLEERSAYV